MPISRELGVTTIFRSGLSDPACDHATRSGMTLEGARVSKTEAGHAGGRHEIQMHDDRSDAARPGGLTWNIDIGAFRFP